MNNIKVITTGGTIGSAFNSDSVSVESTQEKLSSEILLAKNTLGLTVTVDSPLNKNSEDMQPSDWLSIVHSIDAANDDPACKGIVVTHGSDTMAYSVAAAEILSQQEKPVCFTGSYYPPEHPDSDAYINLLASLTLASCESISKGIFAAFRSNIENSEVAIIHGQHLKPMNFDDLFLSSAFNKIAGSYSIGKGLSELALDTIDAPRLSGQVSAEKVQLASSKVAMIVLHPGMDKVLLQAAAQGREVLVIQAYHCGTGPSSADLVQFIKEASPSTKILMGTFPRRYIKTPYKSTLVLKAAGAYIYSEIQSHYLYVFAILALGLSMTSLDIVEKLSPYEV